MEYVKACIADDSFQPSVTQDDLIDCMTEQKLKSYDRCLIANWVHRESMVDVLKCYYKKANVDTSKIIQLSKVEAVNTRNNTPEVFSALMNCTVDNASDIISLRNCLSENANVKFIVNRKSEPVKKKCNSLVSAGDLEKFQFSKKFDSKLIPYLKCLHESLQIVEDGCLSIGKFIEVYGVQSRDLVFKCFKEGVGSDYFDYDKFLECYYK